MSRCALCLLLLGGLLPTLTLGQVDPEDYPEMLERSSETRTLSPEPEMFSESYRNPWSRCQLWSGIPSIGFYPQ
jgi:hypothetical protein